MLRALSSTASRPEIVLGIVHRRAQRRRLRPGPHPRRASPGSMSCGGGWTTRGSSRRAGSRTRWRWPGRARRCTRTTGSAACSRGCSAWSASRTCPCPFQCVATDVRRASGGLVLRRARSSTRSSRRRPCPAILPAVEIDGVPVPRRRHRQRRADLAGRRPRGADDLRPALRHDRPARDPSPSGPSTSSCRPTGSPATTASSATSRRCPPGVEAIVLPTGATPTLRYNDFSQQRRAAHGPPTRPPTASSTATSTTRPRCPPATDPRARPQEAVSTAAVGSARCPRSA